MIPAVLLRTVRHGITPLAIVAVEQGWLPEAAQSDAIEFATIVVAFGITIVWSYVNESRAELRALRREQQARAVDAGRSHAAGADSSP